MCEYCNLVSGQELDIGEQENDLLYIVRHNNDFELKAVFDTVEERNEDRRKINYCPMCGRILNKDMLDDIKELMEEQKCGKAVRKNVAIPVCNEVKLDMQEKICRAIEKSMVDRRKFYTRRYAVNEKNHN